MKHIIKYFCAFFLLLNISCSEDDSSDDNNENMEEMIEETVGPTADSILWDGPEVTFTKEAGSDAALEQNQDRITETVWITRSSEDNGEIHNQFSQTIAEEGSPEGTLWAIGDVSDIENLTFTSFRDAFSSDDIGQTVVGTPFVLYLIEDDIYLSIVFSSWSRGQTEGFGGFSYSRSTPSEM